MSSRGVIDEHRRAGREFRAAGVQQLRTRAGRRRCSGLHARRPGFVVPVPQGAPRARGEGLARVAWDLPGLGLAERPRDFDYTWTGLGRFCRAAIDELGLGRFHLVVHDIGGPVGFELAAVVPDRVASLTLLNTLIEVDTFKRPWSMEPFGRRGIGELYLRTLTKPAFRLLMRLQGVEDMRSISRDELDAYVDLLRMGDGGSAFLRVMRGFERTPEKRDF